MATSGGFSDEERAAISQRAAELASVKNLKGAAKRAREYDACVAAIESLPGLDGKLASRLHLLVAEEAPQLSAKTWYGFPSYAWDDKVVIFFQPASKFDTRYATLGFTEEAALDDGGFWPTSFALTVWNSEIEGAIRQLVRAATAGMGAGGI